MSQETPITNPYVGPRTFTYAQRRLFYGREREARDLLARVLSERLLLFYAQSGAGKSSLLHTRLIPQLQEEKGFVVLPVARVSGELLAGVEQVDNIYAFNLMISIDEGHDPACLAHVTLGDFLARLTRRTIVDSTDQEHKGWVYDATQTPVLATASPNARRYALVVDQFEEIITAHSARWREREDFFRQLAEAMQGDPNLWVVLTLREDYVASLDPYAPLLADRLRARFYMERMDVEAALAAIRQPAAEFGRPFAPGVAEKLVDDLRQVRIPGRDGTVAGQYVEPVQLQVVCFQLWERLQGRPLAPISAEDLQQSGDVDSALAEFYSSALVTVLSTHGQTITQRQLRDWAEKELITKARTRGTIYQGEAETAGMPNRIVQMLIDQFLLRRELRSGAAWVEIVHDRFVAPILQSNREWLQQQSGLVRAAQAWSDAERNPALLYLAPQLEMVHQEVEQTALDSLVTDFLAASETSVRAQAAQAASQRREVELQQAQALAREAEARIHAETQRAAEAEARRRDQAQAATTLRRRALLLAVVGTFAVVAAIAAGWFAVNANTQRTSAIHAAATATFAQGDAERQAANADSFGALALLQKVTAEAASTAESVQRMAAERARQTAEAEKLEAYQVRDALDKSLESLLTAQAVALIPSTLPAESTPTIASALQTPGATSSAILVPTPTATPTSNLAATATTQAIQQQLSSVQATQVAVANAPTGLNLRSGPGTEYATIGVITQGTSVEVLTEVGEWLQVRVSGEGGYAEGYVNRTFLLLPTPTAVSQVSSTATPLAPPEDQLIVVDSNTDRAGQVVAETWNRYGGLIQTIATDLGIDPGTVVALLATQTSGQGVGPDGRLIIRFEVHLFYNYWGKGNEELFRQHFSFDPNQPWTQHQWRADADQPWQEFHGNQASEWEALTFARTLDDTAALLSTSMGMAQILGFQYNRMEFTTVQEMFTAVQTGEREQIVGLLRLIANDSSLLQPLQVLDFTAFAASYNGPGQANFYGEQMNRYYTVFMEYRTAFPAVAEQQTTD